MDGLVMAACRPVTLDNNFKSSVTMCENDAKQNKINMLLLGCCDEV
jgi:hypothetical protein